MFIKKITHRKKGKTYLSYRLVKSERIDGVSRHLTILNMGSLKTLNDLQRKALSNRISSRILGIDNQLDMFSKTGLYGEIEELANYYYGKLLKKQLEKEEYSSDVSCKKEIVSVDLNSFASIESKEIGSEWLCYQAFEELELSNFLEDELAFNSNQSSMSLLSILGRLLHPSSERATANWLNENSAAYELISPNTGRVDRNRLGQAASLLYTHREKIEDYLSKKVSSIFEISDNYYLYDLTNSHFEGQMQGCEKAKFGRNKQKRNDCRQITLGLLTDSNGLPKRSRYYEGNIGEGTTFSDVLDEVSAFSACPNLLSKKPVLVFDAGIANEANLQAALKREFDYICVSRSQHKDLLEQVNELELVSFQNESNQEIKAQFFDREMTYEVEGEVQTVKERVLYIETQAKYKKEQAIIGKKRQRFEEGMKKIVASIENPRGHNSVEKIHQRIGRLKEQCKGILDAYTIETKEEQGKITQLTWVYNPDNLTEKKAGKYFIRTSLQADKEVLLWKMYRTINEIEAAFRVLKSDLNMRPIYHQKEKYILAHLNLAILAYFIVSFIRFRLKQNGINYQWKEIIRIMATQKCNINTILDDKEETIVLKNCTRPNLKANEIYQAIGYKPLPFYRKKGYLNI